MKCADYVNKYVGIPYKEHGRTEEGADCYGIVRMILQNEYGIPMPSYDDDYMDAIEKEALDRILDGRTDWAEVGSPEEGDVVILQTRVHFFHVGIMVNKTHFLNCRPTVGCVVEKLSSPFWQRKVRGFRRYSPGEE